MSGVHDMGGVAGFGPIAPEADEPLFHAPWEARALAITLAMGAWRRWNIDASRHQRELIPAPDYPAMSYYEKWIAGLEAQIAATGLATAEELAGGRADPAAGRQSPPLMGEGARRMLFGKGGYVREAPTPPRFAVGEAVRARDLNPPGHTRLPRYVRGHAGRVTARHGAHVLPDSNAHGQGEDPRHLYQVRFEAAELWGADAGWRGAVHLDLWEPYLEPA
ncbi:MAG TPA: nitrile hydratase subunit beta [Caulobacteraceae bacterium]|jgi:nitrile hydratase